MYNSSTVIWVLVAAFLVYFMQAGFALCEAGLTRAKNTGNILMKNMMDFCIGTPCFWLVGFGIMFAGSGPLIGGFAPFMSGDYSAILPEGVPLWVYAVFQTVFCATAATIVSGSMAERTKFSAYCCYSAAISLIVYPISGHWIWGGGWLAQLGFHDFAGSTAVHFVGGVTACLGAWMLGPRIGKYGKDGKARAIPGHNLTAMALGVFILWFCWFGFNGGSTVAMASDDAMVSRLDGKMLFVKVPSGDPMSPLPLTVLWPVWLPLPQAAIWLIRSALPSSASLPVCSASSPLNSLITLSRLMTLSALFPCTA